MVAQFTGQLQSAEAGTYNNNVFHKQFFFRLLLSSTQGAPAPTFSKRHAKETTTAAQRYPGFRPVRRARVPVV
jgi:hypothetical protein